MVDYILAPGQVELLQIDKALTELYAQASSLIQKGAMPLSANFRDPMLANCNKAIMRVAKVVIEISREVDNTIPKDFDDAEKRAKDGVARLKEALKKIEASVVSPVEGGPTDMTEMEKQYCAAFGRCVSIAREALYTGGVL